MIDFKLFEGFGDRRTNEQTLVVVELLSRLKSFKSNFLSNRLLSRTSTSF